MNNAIHQQLTEALTAALHALNTVPRFKVGGTDSYAIAAQGERALKGSPAKRIYRVTYAITRSEVYEIAATDEEDAETRAFDEGTLIDHEGETTNVTEISTELLDKSVSVTYDTKTIAE